MERVIQTENYYVKKLDKKTVAKYEGCTVEVRMVNPKRTGTVFLRDYTDPETGRLREFIDSFGNPRVKKYTKALTILKLDNPDDLIEYLHVKDHPLYTKNAHPILKVIDITEEANEDIDKREAALDAMLEAKKLRGEKLFNFARVLGINTNGVVESVIKKQVYDIATETPLEFIDKLNDPNRVFTEMLYTGKLKGVFNVKNDVWKFREQIMGASIDEAIKWLKDNDDLTPAIRKEINSK